MPRTLANETTAQRGRAANETAAQRGRAANQAATAGIELLLNKGNAFP